MIIIIIYSNRRGAVGRGDGQTGSRENTGPNQRAGDLCKGQGTIKGLVRAMALLRGQVSIHNRLQ